MGFEYNEDTGEYGLVIDKYMLIVSSGEDVEGKEHFEDGEGAYFSMRVEGTGFMTEVKVLYSSATGELKFPNGDRPEVRRETLSYRRFIEDDEDLPAELRNGLLELLGTIENQEVIGARRSKNE